MMGNSKNDGWSYKDVLEVIIATRSHPDHVTAIAASVKENGINKAALEGALKKLNAPNISSYKNDILDLMINYLNVIVDDHRISEKEYKEFGLLKILFKIEEGDFYNKKYHQVKSVVDAHLEYILEDGKISVDEALTTVDLESMFGLSNDQYEEIEKHSKAKFPKPIKAPKPSISYPDLTGVSKAQAFAPASKPSIPLKPAFQTQTSKPQKPNDVSKIWGVVLVIILGLLVAWLKRSLKHH